MDNSQDSRKLKIIKGNSNLSIKNSKGEYLTIQFSDLSMSHLEHQPQQQVLSSEETIDGIVGIFSAFKHNFLITIIKSEFICKINGKDILQIVETNFIPLNEYGAIPDELQSIIPSLQEIFKSGFYFSNEYDLSNNFSAQLQLTKNNNGVYDKLLEGNPLCLANYKFIDKFAINNVGDNFISNCIYGYVGKVDHTFEDGKKLEITLISRRCIKNFGICYFKQGLDKYGSVANQVETEVVASYNNMEGIFSYLVLSGTVPCYYRELSRGKGNKNIKAYNEYMKSLIDEYWLICFVGLYGKGKTNEILNNQKFKQLLNTDNNNQNNFRYYNLEYDNRAENIDIYVDFVKKRDYLLNLLNYGAMSDKIYQEQKGLLCVNSDNIDESIELQKRLFWYILHRQLLLKNIDINKLFNPNYVFKESENNTPFLSAYLNMFNNSKQILKFQYCQKMEETYARNYQRILEIVFNQVNKPKPLYTHLNYFKKNFSSESKIHLFIGSWNTGATDIRNVNPHLNEWLLPKGQHSSIIPDIYLIGLQEAIELTTKNVISKSREGQEIIVKWEEKIYHTITRGGQMKYIKAQTLDLVGLVFFVFFKEEKEKYIKNFTVKKIKTGLGGTAGNKGSYLVSFNYNNTSIAVSCSHLNAGVSNTAQRISEITEILNTEFEPNANPQSELIPQTGPQNLNGNLNINNLIKENIGNTPSPNGHNGQKDNDNIFNELPPSLSFMNHDAWFIFGDLNFRLDTDYENSINYIEKNDIKHLTEFDQLCKSRIALSDLKDNVDEATITFPPTYKFVLGSNEYANNKNKNRIPSYCDRILFKLYKEEKTIKPIEYNRVLKGGFDCSDHRPIFGIFEVTVMEDILKMKSVYESELKANIDMGISCQYMKKQFCSKKE